MCPRSRFTHHYGPKWHIFQSLTISRPRPICPRFQPCRLLRRCPLGYRRVQRRYPNGYYGSCYDCGRCIKVRPIPPCPFIRCGPIDRDCPKVLPGKIQQYKGKPCRGCPSCVKMCPNFACLVGPRPGCPRVIQGPLMVQNGIPCTGCPTCAERCTDVPCTKILCRRPFPGNLVIRPGKDTCEGCPICLRPCPNRSCPVLPADCKRIPGRVLNTGKGQRPCHDCDRCAPPCEPPICILVFCPNPLPGPRILRPGLPSCPGCPICPGLTPCPIPLCKALPPTCKKVVNNTFKDGGRDCPGCQTCGDDVGCPLKRCVPVTCDDPFLPFTTINGLRCSGCPTCDFPHKG